MFRPIRKRKNEIDRNAVETLLNKSRRGVLAVNGEDGYPYAIPVNYLYDKETHDRLNPQGRLCIITFHSLEDRIVKARFRNNENPCTCPPDFPVCVCGKKSKGKVITRKPIVPGDEELNENQRSKSSKLRVFERI